VSVALVIQHAKRMRRFTFAAVCPAIPYFATLTRKRHDFHSKVNEHKMFILVFSTGFSWNISHSKKNPARYKCTRYSCKVPVILLVCSLNLHFLDRYSKNIQFLNFMEICPAEAEFHAGGRTDRYTDMTQQILAFRNSANAPKNVEWFVLL
jgi:hypothetical protein